MWYRAHLPNPRVGVEQTVENANNIVSSRFRRPLKLLRRPKLSVVPTCCAETVTHWDKVKRLSPLFCGCFSETERETRPDPFFSHLHRRSSLFLHKGPWALPRPDSEHVQGSRARSACYATRECIHWTVKCNFSPPLILIPSCVFSSFLIACLYAFFTFYLFLLAPPASRKTSKDIYTDASYKESCTRHPSARPKQKGNRCRHQLNLNYTR